MKNLILVIAIISSLSLFGQEKNVENFSKGTLNWQHKDYKTDKILGIATQKLYNEILNHTSSKKKIIVAIIDSGVDIEHEDLKSQIWVNKKEIPNNGIDDDHNGYIDDIHGWNFLGNKEGVNIDATTIEMTRYYLILRNEIDNNKNSSPEKIKEFKALEKKFLKRYNDNKIERRNFGQFRENFLLSDSILKKYFKVNELTYSFLDKKTSTDSRIQTAIDYQKDVLKKGITYSGVQEYYKHLQDAAKIYDLYFDPRKEIIGDDLSDINDNNYGNNNVKGPTSEHGTMVAGLIAATRNNNIGIDGICNNVSIMVIRAVPNGDEYDKDIALGIRYAVDNGANIINMSFGKAYSPYKSMVWDAMRYASSKNVLMIKAAGNDNLNIDIDVHYPTAFTDNGKIENVITVGASDQKRNKKMKAIFSNYGAKSVDFFAPGVDIVSSYPSNSYKKASGTSFSSPISTGVAALIWSYFPKLTAKELKSILLESVYDVSKRKVIVAGKGKLKDQKVRFKTLSQTGGIINAYAAYKLAENKKLSKKQ